MSREGLPKETWPYQHKVFCRESPIYKANQELSVLKKKLTEQEETLGVDHDEPLNTVNEIGNFLSVQGQLKEAETYWCRALEGRERTPGRENPYTLQSASNLGSLMYKQGKLSLAEQYFSLALERRMGAVSRARSPRHAHGCQQPGLAGGPTCPKDYTH